MDDIDPSVLARKVATGYLQKHRGENIDEARAAALESQIRAALDEAIRAERVACARRCQKRAALWEASAERPAAHSVLLAEARARSNEALYLADAILGAE
jgi:hypothetical protein